MPSTPPKDSDGGYIRVKTKRIMCIRTGKTASITVRKRHILSIKVPKGFTERERERERRRQCRIQLGSQHNGLRRSQRIAARNLKK